MAAAPAASRRSHIAGLPVSGLAEATSGLEMRLKRMDLDFINGDPVKQGGLMNRGKITRQELINFCFHLEQLARAGVALIESLTDLRDTVDNPRFREILAGMIESIELPKKQISKLCLRYVMETNPSSMYYLLTPILTLAPCGPPIFAELPFIVPRGGIRW